MQFEFAEKYDRYEITVISPLPKVTSILHGVRCVHNFYALINERNKYTRNLKALWLGFSGEKR